MRIYESCEEMHNEEKRNLHEMGVLVCPDTMQDKIVTGNVDYRTLELTPATFSILNGSDRDDWLQKIGYSLAWAREELRERLYPFWYGTGMNPGEAWRIRENVWSEFIHDGKFAYTYSERFAIHHALRRIISELGTHGETRQAVLPVFGVDDLINLGGKKRVPCSLHYQFLRRRGHLEMIYVMRSSDFLTHFPYDIWLAISLQAFVAKQLGIPTGMFTFFSGSLHLYAKDADPGVF